MQMTGSSTSSPSSADTAGTANMSTGMRMGMSTFSASTKVTLFFANWTTDTPAKYFGTLIFVFVITILNRFLGAWRSQLSRKWADQAAIARAEQIRRRRMRRRDRRRQSQRAYREDEPDPKKSPRKEQKEEWQPLSPDSEGTEIEDNDSEGVEEETSVEKRLRAPVGPRWVAVFGGPWRAGNPWMFSIDFPRAMLEGLRALIGYLLMLAVMTFNVGFLIAVISAIIVGELLLGRFTNGSGWEEGGCHDG